MNFLQMVQRLHSETLRSTSSPTTVATTDVRQVRMVDAVKDAWREIQSERDWRWMRSSLDAPLTINQQTYTGANLSATRFGRWRKEDREYSPQVYISGQQNSLWPIAFWQLDEFRQHYIYRQMGGTLPQAWTVDESEQLLLGPKPAVAYQLRIDYWKEPFELGTVNADPNLDEPDMPSRFHMILVWRALQGISRSGAKPEILSRAEENYDRMYDDLVFDQARLPHLP